MNMTYTLNTQNCTAVFDAQTGALQTLTDSANPQCSWVAKDGRFGVPFLSSSQRQTNFFPIALEKDGEALCGKSHSGVSAICWQAQQGSLCAEYRGSTMAGPRSGVELDFNFLDLPGDTPWRSQCMPHILYTDPRRQYAYFVFSTADERYLTLCVEAPFAAWREMEIPFSIVTGTSVGALNGAFMVQGDYEFAKSMWESINAGQVLDIPGFDESWQETPANSLHFFLSNILRLPVKGNGSPGENPPGEAG